MLRLISTNVRLLMALYVLELSGLLLDAEVTTKGAKSLLPWTLSRPELFFVLLLLSLLVISAKLIAREFRKSRLAHSACFGQTLGMNLVTLLVLVCIGEEAVRMLSVHSPDGRVLLNHQVLTRDWDEVVAHNRELIQRAEENGSYFVEDMELGWTVGRNRMSKDGLYFSSAEGIRSGHTGIKFAKVLAQRRIALVGDSMTMGFEAKYEDTWGRHLEQSLGSHTQVLNFGVDAYGIDQAYLRYKRDVRPWHPDVVIFGLINHDLYRSLAVYCFVSFPEWDCPYAKPRFVVRDGQLALLNSPVPSPHAIFSTKSIDELPFIEYDRGYSRKEGGPIPFQQSYLLRFLLGRPFYGSEQRPEVSDKELKLVNGEVLKAFVRLAEGEGTIPIVVYLPARRDFDVDTGLEHKEMPIAKTVLHQAGIEFVDMTSCVRQVRKIERFLDARPHYSPRTNRAIAKCLKPVVQKNLTLKNHSKPTESKPVNPGVEAFVLHHRLLKKNEPAAKGYGSRMGRTS